MPTLCSCWTTAKFLPRKSDEDNSSRALKTGRCLLPPIYFLLTLQLDMLKPGLSVAEYSSSSTWMKQGDREPGMVLFAAATGLQLVPSSDQSGGPLFCNSFAVREVPDTAARYFAGGLAIGHQAENDMRGADLILPEGMTCCVVSLKTRGGVSSELTKWKEQAVADTKSWLLWDQEEDKSDLQLTCYGLDGNFGYLSREVRGLLKNILVTRPDPLKGAGSRVDQANAAVSVRGRLRRVSGGRHESMLMDYSVSSRITYGVMYHKGIIKDVPDDKRAILACLVSSVYSLQHDRSKNYTGTPQALAPPWWTSFNYELLDVILGNDKLRINGAVFVWNYKNHWKPARAPMVVLALRGTDSLTSDYIVDFKIANQELYKTGRFTAAYNALRNAVAWHGKDNVCITGHSLGAAVALSAARMMASQGQFVEAHLFNPPFSSSTAPYKSLFGAETYSNLQEVYTVAKAGLVNLLVDAAKRRESEAEFAALGSWYPDMYVHPSDPVCSGFLEHFKNYQYMLQGKYARLAMPHESIRGVLCSSKAKPHHLIPSARLHVPADDGKAASARDAHSLTQWWSDGAVVQVQFVNLTDQGLKRSRRVFDVQSYWKNVTGGCLPRHDFTMNTFIVCSSQRLQMVASAGGLVCVFRTHRGMVDPADDVFHLVVGNPVTQEWSELPPLHWEDRERCTLAGVIDFAMFVDKNGFKVGLHYTAVDFSGHWCCIYDSATRSWSSLPKLPFSPAYVKMKAQRLSDYSVDVAPPAVFPGLDDYFYDLTILGFYDFGRGRWSTGEVVRSLRITTGLEDKVDPDGEILRCVLPLPGLCTARLWEYNGQRYLASGWVYAGGYREAGESGVDGYGVWKVDDKGGLVAVSAKTHISILRQVYAGQRSVGAVFRCSVHAEANLVIFSEIGLMFVYDLSTGDWGGVGGHVDEYSQAVIFRPSLRAPR
ncbi:hypothetical protein SELMODRAFT_416916 [Selaginella moellendorffii]|uniref:Uncharacterized protein n=1 Tax=Selaginella moellendorffii TaxID=88036 RepID=D8S0T3_SELML|nr:hypothetical protein SELMODRAFT_416916 [Selaginella moellendorffii]